MYYFKIKEPDPFISRRKKRYVAGTTQTEPMSPIEQVEQTKYLAKIPTFGLRQPIFIPRGVHVQ
jgi:hypothetical protein